MAITIKLTEREADAVALYVFDPCHVEWSEAFPDDDAANPPTMRLDGRKLSFGDEERDAVWRRLQDAANAADEDAERGAGPEFRRDCEALTRICGKVIRA